MTFNFLNALYLLVALKLYYLLLRSTYSNFRRFLRRYLSISNYQGQIVHVFNMGFRIIFFVLQIERFKNFYSFVSYTFCF